MLEEVVRYLVLGLLLLVFTYVFTRAASIGYFRTRLEFWRTINREKGKGGSEDGQV
jgi:hypothetical protein